MAYDSLKYQHMTEEEIEQVAREFAKRNRKQIAGDLADPKKYAPTLHPVSVFMAGSPGAGKTEFSKLFIQTIEDERESRVIRIDADELRELMPGYTGKNSALFNGAVSLVVEKMHDFALKQGQSFLLDGTMSHYEKAVSNIRRSLDKGRTVAICYLYQKPEVAWKFTQARELVEGRNIPKGAFIDQFLGARDTVERLQGEFGRSINIVVVKKDFVKNTVEHVVLLPDMSIGGDSIDDYLGKRYTREELDALL